MGKERFITVYGLFDPREQGRTRGLLEGFQYKGVVDDLCSIPGGISVVRGGDIGLQTFHNAFGEDTQLLKLMKEFERKYGEEVFAHRARMRVNPLDSMLDLFRGEESRVKLYQI